MKAPAILIESVERSHDAQDNYSHNNPASLFTGSDLGDEKKNRRVADQLKKEIAADSVVYGIKGIKNGQYEKGQEGEGESYLPDLQNPLCCPSIKPEEEGPTQEDYLYGRRPKEYMRGKKGGNKKRSDY